MSPHCSRCGQRIPIDQAYLERGEIERFDYEAPGGFPNVIKLQCVKAAADHFDVADWTSQVDSSLSMSENIARMEQLGEPSMRDLRMTDGGEDDDRAEREVSNP